MIPDPIDSYVEAINFMLNGLSVEQLDQLHQDATAKQNVVLERESLTEKEQSLYNGLTTLCIAIKSKTFERESLLSNNEKLFF